VATTHENIGRLLASQGNVDTALAHFRNALCIREGQVLLDSSLVAELCIDIGRILKAKGELEEAMESFAKAKDALEQVGLEETDQMILYCILMIGEVHLAHSHYEQAMEIADDLIHLKPDFANAYGLKASILFARGDYDTESYREARRQSQQASFRF
jgi:tetratricopeptide (TPR) repeat protein